MRTQREFFQDAVDPTADIVFVGCNVTNTAEPPLPGGGTAPRRQVVVGGRRVKTVDVHAHCAVPEAMALMGMTVSPQATAVDHILGTPSLSDAERAAILGDTACKLLRIAS